MSRRHGYQRRGASKHPLPKAFHGPLDNPNWFQGFRVLYLDVPFAERSAARHAGAHFNPDRSAWWIFAAGDQSAFARWIVGADGFSDATRGMPIRSRGGD
jgi:hypothetical protein